MKTRNFERVSVVDMAGVVKVSSMPALVGQPYKAEATQTSVASGSSRAYSPKPSPRPPKRR